MKRRMTARFWMFMIVTTLVVFGVSFAVLQHRYGQSQREYEEVSARRDGLVLQIKDLEKELEYTKTDDYIMRAARDQLGLIMPSEIRYVSSK